MMLDDGSNEKQNKTEQQNISENNSAKENGKKKRKKKATPERRKSVLEKVSNKRKGCINDLLSVLQYEGCSLSLRK